MNEITKSDVQLPSARAAESEVGTKTFQITRDVCESWIQGVCTGCGGELSAIETVDNANNPTHWVGCLECECFGNGVDPLIFKIARTLVEDHTLVPYSHMGSIFDYETLEAREYWLRSQTRGASSIVGRIAKMLQTPAEGGDGNSE